MEDLSVYPYKRLQIYIISNIIELYYPQQYHRNCLTEGFSNAIEIKQPIYLNNSKSQQPTAAKAYTPTISSNVQSVLLPRVEERQPNCNEAQPSPKFYNEAPSIPIFPLSIQTNENHDPLVLVPKTFQGRFFMTLFSPLVLTNIFPFSAS